MIIITNYIIQLNSPLCQLYRGEFFDHLKFFLTILTKNPQIAHGT